MEEFLTQLHPISVHFTASLLSLSTLFYLIFKFHRNKKILFLADTCLLGGYGITIVTVGFGILSLNLLRVVFENPAIRDVLEHHHFWMHLSVTFYGVAVILRLYSLFKSKSEPSWWVLLLVVLGVVSLLMTGYYGGILVYKYHVA